MTIRFANTASSSTLSKLSRRDFLKLSGLASLSLGLTACGPAAQERAEDAAPAAQDTGFFTALSCRHTCRRRAFFW